ncbi:MAG: nitrogenase iron protein [Myxococcales bacterium]|nr:nitrogenase iron protein [Myxococcales bacterium]
MHKIAVYGKGGIGKSTISSHLSAVFAEKNLKVLHVGCDPKHDSTMRIAPKDGVPTVIQMLRENPGWLRSRAFVQKGRFGIDLVECGGPEPGAGCGGRGVAKMFEMFTSIRLLERGDWDVSLFDVLGDVVCGGFAAPMRQGFAEKAYIVCSEELMAMYAANNVVKAITTNAGNGVTLGGIIANTRDNENGGEILRLFAEALGTQVVEYIPRSPIILEAEGEMKTVVEYDPTAPIVDVFRSLADKILAYDPSAASLPTPLEDREFNDFTVDAFRKTA